MDTRFLAGCSTIAILSLTFYAMLAWPFFVFEAHLRAGLAQIALYGALPVLVAGVLATRAKGLEGATALVGGSIAGAIFAYLRLDALTLGKLGDLQELPPPDWPDSWAWLIPLAWCLAVAATALLALPKRETQDEGAPGSDR
jgi:hypothetical protein